MEAEHLLFSPIGIVRSSFTQKYDAPHQPRHHEAVIELYPHCNYEQALEDIEGFERIWLIWAFHKSEHWKPKVLTPRDSRKHGVFATRSPHRPNPLAMSVVELLSLDKLQIHIRGADMIDGTPVLDIKPYIPAIDSFPESRAGWVDEVNARPEMMLVWSSMAEAQAEWIEEQTGLPLRSTVTMRLRQNHLPSSFNRIEQHDEHCYCIAYKAWRILFSLYEKHIELTEVFSDYRESIPHHHSQQLPLPADYAIHEAFCRLWKT